jgi:hypothetical protein
VPFAEIPDGWVTIHRIARCPVCNECMHDNGEPCFICGKLPDPSIFAPKGSAPPTGGSPSSEASGSRAPAHGWLRRKKRRRACPPVTVWRPDIHRAGFGVARWVKGSPRCSGNGPPPPDQGAFREHADRPTLSPSVWRTEGCRSHFILRRGQLIVRG